MSSASDTGVANLDGRFVTAHHLPLSPRPGTSPRLALPRAARAPGRDSSQAQPPRRSGSTSKVTPAMPPGPVDTTSTGLTPSGERLQALTIWSSR